jgi:hypothetical protein
MARPVCISMPSVPRHSGRALLGGSCRMSRKSVWPILAGLLLLAALSVVADMILRGFFPKAFGPSEAALGALASAVTILYAGAFGVLSSYLTARLAPGRPVVHALILGGIAFLFAIAGLVGSWHRAPAWFNVGFLATVLASAWLGGVIRARQLEP